MPLVDPNHRQFIEPERDTVAQALIVPAYITHSPTRMFKVVQPLILEVWDRDDRPGERDPRRVELRPDLFQINDLKLAAAAISAALEKKILEEAHPHAR
jgi:hypothetical protein